MDISKVFDRVSHFYLIQKLLDRGMPLWFIRTMKDCYSKCNALVKWGNVISDSFSVEGRVRQGGVLSRALYV